jgi:hypothetical protein
VTAAAHDGVCPNLYVDENQVVFLGSVGPRRRADVLRDAAPLLRPISLE